MFSVFTTLGLLVMLAAASDVRTPDCRGHRMLPGPPVRKYPTDNATGLRLFCSIPQLTRDDLTGFINLNNIFIHSNTLVHIDLDILSSVPTLDALTVEAELHDLPVFPACSCLSLTWLSLSTNLLQRIKDHTFSACEKLEHVDLSYNLIEHLHPKSFHGLRKLESLNLQYNKITFLSPLVNHKLSYLSINNNRLSYLPRKFFTKVILLKFDFYGNPWQCACLLELLADAKRAGVEYYRDWQHEYNGTDVECTYNGTLGTCYRNQTTV